MSASAVEKSLGKRLMAALIDPTSRIVQTGSLKQLEALLSHYGFQKASDVAYGPPGGRQLFYKQGRIVVRVKTKGDEAGFRANQPHLSVALTDGAGFDWFNDLAKFNHQGMIAAKSMGRAEAFRPIDHQGNPQRFVVLLGGQYDGPGADAWAQRTHFSFPGNYLGE